MSVLFRKAVEKHLEQLKKRAGGKADREAVEKQLAHIKDLLKIPMDGRFRRSLTTQLKQLENPPEIDTDVKERIAMLEKVRDRLAVHPEYKARKGKRIPRS